MKITDLHIDGFGVWSGIDFHSLSPDITVFYGPNEAGKSTLLQFVRSICFGYTPERRGFVNSVQSGRAGGWMNLVNDRGRHQVARHHEGIAAANGFGTLKITGPDGALESDGQLRSLLGNLDESTFNNVFAVGLREIQELGTLSDTAAAQYLYDLSAGRDRVSLSEVLRELDNSRARLAGTPEKPALFADLLAQRDRLQQEVDELRTRTPRYGRVAAQGVGLNQSFGQVEAEIVQWQRKIRMLDLASILRGKWHERQSLDQQLSVLDKQESLPGDLLQQLERLNFKLRQAKQRRAKVLGELRVIKGEAAALTMNENLWKNGAKIEVLAEQVPWNTALEKQVQTLEVELAEQEAHYKTRREKIGSGTSNSTSASVAPTTVSSGSSPASNQRGWSHFRPLAQRLKNARREFQAAQETHAQYQKTKSEIQSTVSSKLGGRSQADLVGEVEKVGQLVTNLRRRIQLEDKLQQVERQKTELESDAGDAFDDMMLPPWLLTGLGGFFVMGVVLILAGLFYPGSATGKVGWWMALLGLTGTAVTGAAKWFFEFNAEQHAQSCDKQLAILTNQFNKLETERSDLDIAIPKGGGSLTARLQAAESQLATLQELLPLDAKRLTGDHDTRSVDERLRRTEEDYQKAKQGWKKLLRAAGLDENLSPSDVAKETQDDERQQNQHRQQQLAADREQQRIALEQAAKREELASLERNLLAKREELANRRREWEGVVTRVRHTLSEVGLLAAGRSPFEQLLTLRKELDEQRMLLDRKKSIHRKRKTLRREMLELSESYKRQQRRRQQLLKQANLSDYAELQRRISDQARLDELRRGRDDLAREIAGTLSGEFSEDALKEHLSANAQTFEASRKEADAKLQTTQQKLSALAQQRGEWLQQSKATQSDRRLQQKQLELSCVEKKLAEAVERWQVLAMTHNLLEATRREFETERQPEALREASSYFEQLTAGRYRRVWTPFGEHTLRVDDVDGQTWAAEKLSRGTREQLFLALRLALVAQYHRRGVQVPLVLDDVLVNYDTTRARAAAKVLREFAAEGHQLLIFTCHEHILEAFRELHVDCRHLRGEVEPAPVVEERPITKNIVPAVTLEPEPAKRKLRRERPVKREEPEPMELVPEPRPVIRPAARSPVFEVVPPPQVIEKQELAPPRPVFAPLPPPVERRRERSVVTPPPAPVVVEHLRLDPAQPQRSVNYLHRNKWMAEEFDGELEDWVAVRGHDVAVQPVRPVSPSSRTVATVRQGFAPTTVVERVDVSQDFRADEDNVGPPSTTRVVEVRSRHDLPEIVIERPSTVQASPSNGRVRVVVEPSGIR